MGQVGTGTFNQLSFEPKKSRIILKASASKLELMAFEHK